MKLSIIIPYYNSENYIEKCVDSLLHQGLSKDDYEIVIVNDGSTHDITVLNHIVSNFENVSLVSQPNSGPSSARNNGLNHAQGQYIFFCDSDDFLPTNVLGRLVNAAIENKVDVQLHKVKRVKDGFMPSTEFRSDKLIAQHVCEDGLSLIFTPPIFGQKLDLIHSLYADSSSCVMNCDLT